MDREERPDVDKVYMTFVQATTGSGGWPMSVWLTPDLKPFLGGTYFPPEDRGGRPGFSTVLKRIADGWKNDREGIIKHGDNVAKQLSEMAAEHAAASAEGRRPASLCGGLNQLAKRFDAEHGGFGECAEISAAEHHQFPPPHGVRDGLGATPETEQGDRELAKKMALFTLREDGRAAACTIIVGGGFHRYSVDKFWHIPHFEKMLYDQAQLAGAYVDAFQLTQRHALGESRARRARLRPARHDGQGRRLLLRRGRRLIPRARQARAWRRRLLRLDEDGN